MTISELFRGLLTHVVSFLIFLHARCKSEFSVLYLRMARAVFEGTNMVNAKGSNGHYRSWCKDRNSCRTVSKSIGFKEKQKVFSPGNRSEMSNLEVNCSMNM